MADYILIPIKNFQKVVNIDDVDGIAVSVKGDQRSRNAPYALVMGRVKSDVLQSAVAKSDVGVSIPQLVAGKVPLSQQTPDPNKISVSQKGVANGVVPLDSNNKVPSSYINITGVRYLGAWDASTNTPTLTNGSENENGDRYFVRVGGSVDFGDGLIEFKQGDSAIYDGEKWDVNPVPQLNAPVFDNNLSDI